MSHSLPHTLYTCPCTKNSTAQELFDRPPRRTEEASDEDEEEEQTFNPKSPRAKFALYPLEHLLFCNECHEIRCPRCYYEEALYFYCPTCLFEVQTNVVKCETNRYQASLDDVQAREKGILMFAGVHGVVFSVQYAFRLWHYRAFKIL